MTLKTEVDDDQFDVRRIGRMLWTRAPLVALLVVLAGTVAFVVSSSKTEQYQATAKVRVVDPNSEAVFDGVQIRTDPKRDVDTQLALLRSDDLRADVDQSLGDDARRISGVSMAGVGSTDLISITVTSPSPEVAAAAANAFANLYVNQRKDQVSAAFTSKADELRAKSTELDEQIRSIDAQLADRDLSQSDRDVLQAQRATLVTQQSDLQTRATEFDVEAATRSGNVELAETATVPTTPVSPKPVRDAAIAGVLALLVGIGLAFLLDRLDDKVHNADDVEVASGGVPAIGVIPIDVPGRKGARKLAKNAPRHLVALDSTTAEAFRALRSNLRFSAVGTKRTAVLLTSSEGAEGKSTVAANLAVVLAESGLRVVLVSADLRKPTLCSFFGIPETERGLTSVLLGDASLTQSLVSVPLASGRSLYVLPAGPLPQNPAEVLGSRAMREVLESLERAGADFVLIDSPPVLPVADALALSQFADGVVVLAGAGRTPKGHLAETVERLRQVNAELIGVVLNAVPTKGRYSRYYGGYGYGYRSAYTADRPSPDVIPVSEHTQADPDLDQDPRLVNGNGNGHTPARGSAEGTSATSPPEADVER